MIYEDGKLSAMAQALEQPMREWLKMKEVVDRFDRGKASVLAKCFLRTEGDTMKEREMIALADREYTAFLEEWHTSAMVANDKRVTYETRLNMYYAYQSELAYLRDSMKRLGG